LSVAQKRVWADEDYKKRRIEKRKTLPYKITPKRLEDKKRLRNQWKNKESREMLLKGLSLRPNKPEKIVIKLVRENDLPFNYVGNGKVWFYGENHVFNPDFLSKNPKHIIEVFGDYWHNLPRNKKKDVERLKTYEGYGYKTLVIWEHELKDLDRVLHKIRGFISG